VVQWAGSWPVPECSNRATYVGALALIFTQMSSNVESTPETNHVEREALAAAFAEDCRARGLPLDYEPPHRVGELQAIWHAGVRAEMQLPKAHLGRGDDEQKAKRVADELTSIDVGDAAYGLWKESEQSIHLQVSKKLAVEGRDGRHMSPQRKRRLEAGKSTKP
jgi:hypothetical protein